MLKALQLFVAELNFTQILPNGKKRFGKGTSQIDFLFPNQLTVN